MLINSAEAEKRLNSSSNLMNRLQRPTSRSASVRSAMSLFVRPTEVIPQDNLPAVIPANAIQPIQPLAETPSVYIPNDNGYDEVENKPDNAADKVLDNLDLKVKQQSVQTAALEVLGKSIQKLNESLESGFVPKPKDLADIAKKMSGIVTDVKKNTAENKDNNKNVHLHFYTPERKKLSDFEVIDVG